MKVLKVILTVTSLCFISTASFSADAPVYIGFSAGQTNISQNVNGDYDIATTGSITLGVILDDTSVYQTSAEGTYTQTLAKENVTINSVPDEYKEETIGLFLSAKTKSDFYAKAKLGAVNHRITTNTIVAYNKLQLAAGIGFGLKNDSGGITEIEYTVVGEDLSFFNIGYLF